MPSSRSAVRTESSASAARAAGGRTMRRKRVCFRMVRKASSSSLSPPHQLHRRSKLPAACIIDKGRRSNVDRRMRVDERCSMDARVAER